MTPTFTTPELREEEQREDHAAEGPLLFPCTPPQERCWFLEKLKPGNSALNVAVRWEVRGKIDVATIEQAFRIVMERHEILRTRLIDVNGTPMQEVLEDVEFKISVIDLTNLPEADRAERAASIHHEESKQPFDLGKAPLMRVTAIRTAADRTLLLLLIHQAAFDGWSIRVIGREVGHCIAALDAKRAPDLPELPLQYGDYSLWLKDFFDCADFEAEKTYWLTHLKDAPYFEIEPDHPRGATRTHNGALCSVMLPMDAGNRLGEVAKAQGVSMFNLGCAVIAALLHRISGENDVLFGTQVAGRDDIDLEALIGVFINNLVLRFNTSGDLKFSEFLARVEETVRGALTHQKLPFHRLVELKNPSRDMSRTPLIAINVILQRAFLENAKYETFELIGIPSPSPGAFYDLNFQMVNRPEGWRMSLEYNTDLYEKSTAEGIVDAWKAGLEAVAENPDLRLSQLPAPEPRPRRSRVPQGPHAAIREALQSHPDAKEAASPAHAPVEHPGFDVLLEKVARVWAEVLNVTDVQPHSNFFALGGHSLLALRMLMRLEEVLGGRVALATLFGAPVLRNFGEALVSAGVGLQGAPGKMPAAASTEEARDADLPPAVSKARASALMRRIVHIKTDGGKTPVIVINNTSDLRPLARHMCADRPLVDIQFCPSWIPQDLPPRYFGDIARDAVEMIRLARPRGPYILLGLCLFGSVAFEAARLLKQEGEEVPLVVICDTWAPGHRENLPWAHKMARRWAIRISDVREDWRRYRNGEMSLTRFLSAYRIVRQTGLIKLAMATGLLKSDPEGDVLTMENRWYTEYLARCVASSPNTPYDGRVLLVRSTETRKGRLFDPAMGWADLVQGPFRVVHCPAKHAEMLLEGGIKVIADETLKFMEEMKAEAS